MTKADLISKMQQTWDGVKKAEAEGYVNTVLKGIEYALVAGEKVQLAGLGIFSVKETKSRTGRNPKTGETIEIAAGKKVKFTAAKELKKAVNWEP